nr:MAG TPA: exonuclease [Caudoviricetes sp.]
MAGLDQQYIISRMAEIQAENEHRKGKYGTISGYISATRLLSEMRDDTGLQEWRKSVGEKKADAITEAATTRGRRMHELIESYFNNESIDLDLTKPGDSHYNKIKPLLSKVNPWFVETCLFSDKLSITGKTDTIGLYDGVLSTIDYKTSRKPKKLEWMKSYGVQIALYSIMFYDMLGVSIRQGVLLNAPDDDDSFDLPTPPQCITFKVADYVPLALSILKQYREGKRKCIVL